MSDKDVTIKIDPGVRQQMEDDPKIASAIRDLNARMRQALHGVDLKDREAVGAALRAIGMKPVTDPDHLARLEEEHDDGDDDE